MTAQRLETFPLPGVSVDAYRIEGVDRVMTPALAIYPEIVDSNIDTTVRLLRGNADRWRAHVKTAKLGFVIRRMAEHGVRNFKCSTTLELLTSCENGAADVVVAYPMVGAGARRVQQLAEQFPRASISALVESREQIETWVGSRVGLFIDVNPGMNRTGIAQNRGDEILALARAIQRSGQPFRGLHYYDGHLSSLGIAERERVAHSGYDVLMEIISFLQGSRVEVQEVITAGTPAFPCALSYSRFTDSRFIHRASPGTVIYNDCSSLGGQLPREWDFRPAAVVVTTVVSRPCAGRFTCDAGHKTVSADAGVPTCAVIGEPNYSPSKPSEEHLPIDVIEGPTPEIGDVLYLVPRHVCPTVNNFDHALIVSDGKIVAVERVTARGREAPV